MNLFRTAATEHRTDKSSSKGDLAHLFHLLFYFIYFSTTDGLGLVVSPCMSVLYRYVMLILAKHNWVLSLSLAKGSLKWLLRLVFNLSCSCLSLEYEVMKGKKSHPFEIESCSWTHCLKTCGTRKLEVWRPCFFLKFKI